MRLGLAVAIAALAVSAPAQGATAPAVQAQAYIVQSSVDGHTLAARRADAPRAMASITKLMTALVALEHLSLDDVVTVPPVAARVGESTLDLRAGQRITVRDLLIGTLVPSANDAATTLAVAAGGSEARFVPLMNREGAPSSASVARTTAIRTGSTSRATSRPRATSPCSFATRSASPRSAATRGMPRATLSDGRVVESTDNLLGRFGGLVGGKTGHTSDAGWSQAAFARSGGVGITAVVLGSPTEAQRDGDLAALLRFGLDSYRTRDGRRPRAHVRDAPRRLGARARSGRRAAADRPAGVDRPAARRAGRRPGRRSRFRSPRASGSGRSWSPTARASSPGRRSSPPHPAASPGAAGKAWWVTRRAVHHLVGLVS